MNAKTKKTILTILKNILAWIFSLIMLIPLLLIVINAFKPDSEALTLSLTLPKIWEFSNFAVVIEMCIRDRYNVEENAVDLSDQPWVETYDEFAKEQTSVGDKVYGMTYFDVSTDYYVIYNKKIFEENKLEVPTTFAEFEEVCQTLLDNEVTPIYEPCADGWHQTMWFTEIGGKYEDLVPNIVDDLNNNKIKFADVPELKQALDQLNDMAQKGYFGDNYPVSYTHLDVYKRQAKNVMILTLAKTKTPEVCYTSGVFYSFYVRRVRP